MIFHEIYSAYYNAVAKILSAVQSDTEAGELRKIVERYAFGESALAILPALKSGRWQLMTKELTTPIRHTPTMPLTALERSWLKAISLDKRIRLFDMDTEGLSDVEPLFTESDIRVYDVYSDGDPFEDEEYIKRFKLILRAQKERLALRIEMRGRDGRIIYRRCIPSRLEYSERDDKFRMYTGTGRHATVINLASIISVKLYGGERVTEVSEPVQIADTVTLEILDERNALERVMLHFAHFEKRAEKIGRRRYRLTVTYNRNDVNEIVIRVLSFGPMVRVVAPDSFASLIKERLIRQMKLGSLRGE
ncbi:MAG: WYL domain-containing protein [Clostridia bacterium]|nr:WYL domain-containing protein [Clostridia bacterium]